MAPLGKRQKTNTGTTKNQKHDIALMIAYSPQKAQIRHPPKAKVKLWIVIFVFFAKKLSIKHFILLKIYRLSIFYCILSWLLYGKHIWLV